MTFLTTALVKVAERQRRSNLGQTMAEYALIVALIAVVVFVAYQTMGADNSDLVNRLGTGIAAAS